MHDSESRDVASLRNVVAFAVLTHTLDLITTQWRDPGLNHEGNPFYQFVEHLGYTGWPWLVATKVVLVTALGFGFRWYLEVRPRYLPDRVVSSPRALIWYGMWDRKPYPSSLWARLFNRRKLAFLALALGGMALPGSGAAALFISVDNACVALQHAIPIGIVGEMLLGTIILVAIWWYRAYWRYYRTCVQDGLIPNNPAASTPGGD